MLRRGQKGQAVLVVQNRLLALGYNLPRWGADGDLGDETLTAMQRFLRDHTRVLELAPGVVGDDALRLLENVADAVAKQVEAEAFATRARWQRVRDPERDCVFGRRTWRHIDTVVLHQSACDLAETTSRMRTIDAHAIACRGSAGVIEIQDPLDVVAHCSNVAWNWRSWGLETNGLFAGDEGRPETVWDDPTTARRERPDAFTDELVENALHAIGTIVARVAAHGGKIAYLAPHRIFSRSRRNCPGGEAWRRIALPAMGKHDLKLPAGTFGGYEVPRSWDPSKTAAY